jgi:hypothetical protein
MKRDLYRTCPRCSGYVGIILHDPDVDEELKAVHGNCVQCSYRMSWLVIRGRRRSLRRVLRNRNPQEPSFTPFRLVMLSLMTKGGMDFAVNLCGHYLH